MHFKADIEPSIEDAIARVYRIVTNVLGYKNSPDYIASDIDIAALEHLRQKLLEASDTLQYLQVYLKGSMK